MMNMNMMICEFIVLLWLFVFVSSRKHVISFGINVTSIIYLSFYILKFV